MVIRYYFIYETIYMLIVSIKLVTSSFVFFLYGWRNGFILRAFMRIRRSRRAATCSFIHSSRDKAGHDNYTNNQGESFRVETIHKNKKTIR